MSTLIPEKFPSRVSPEMSQGDDIEVIIARVDEKLRELEKLLRAQENSNLEEQSGFQVGLSDLNKAKKPEQGDDDPSKSWRDPMLHSTKAKFGVTPEESSAIMQRLEKLDEDVKMRERLARGEKHKQALTIYAIACTFLALFMVFSSYFLQESYASNKTSPDQAAEPSLSATMGVPNPAAVISNAPPGFTTTNSGDT
jgi:hypothetical protein